MDGVVYTLAVSGTTLYAGGSFSRAGGRSAASIAAWNGTAWSPLGSGMDGVVYTLAVSGTTLYAGGEFSSAGGVAANRIAAWNGTAWSALGSGMTNTVLALAVSGGTLYAGGLFTTAGGVAANRIVAWDGTAWSPLGSGLNAPVFVLAVVPSGPGTTLYAGGGFTTAGGKPSTRFGIWHPPAPPPTVTPTATPTAPPTPTGTPTPGGCGVGYWKSHSGSWPAPYTPTTRLNSVFTLPSCGGISSLGSDSLQTALAYGGGSSVKAAAQTLLRQAVAALLNAASGIGYPLNQAQIRAEVNTALASCQRQTILNEATRLERFNSSTCPLP